MDFIKDRGILILALALAMVVPVMGTAAASGDEDDGDRVPRELREWTVMLYIGAESSFYETYDENGDEIIVPFTLGQCERAFAEAEIDLAMKDVNLVVFVDRADIEGTFIYDDSDLQNHVHFMPEANSSDPDVLGGFVRDCMSLYPANEYLLVGKNGHAWCGICPDDDGGAVDRAMMPIDGIAKELLEIQEETGERVDVLAFDGDNMASVEAAYELRHAVDYLVASQQDVPLDGFPYYLFLKHLLEGSAGTDTVTPNQLACTIAEDYVYYYNNTDGKKVLLDHLLSNSQMAVTASAFEMGEDGGNIERIVVAFDAVLDHMISSCDGMWIPLNRNNIASARDYALIGKMGDQAGYEWLPDIYSWLDMTDRLVQLYPPEDPLWTGPDTDFTALVDEFKQSILDARVCMVECQILARSNNSDPHGLNFWFPPTWLQWETLDMTRERTYEYAGSNVELPAEYYCVDCPYNYSECGLDMVEDTSWIEFFGIYYEARWLLYNSGMGESAPRTAYDISSPISAPALESLPVRGNPLPSKTP
jgi:hypothetical protein